MDMNAILFPLFAIWGIFSIVLLFQKRIEWHLRISALLICAFYIVLFYSEAHQSFESYRDSFRTTLGALLTSVLPFVGLLLLVFWPFVILISFYSIHASLARGLLRIFTVLTLLFWFLQFALPRMGWHLDPFLSRVPEKVHVPEIQTPDVKMPDLKIPEVKLPSLKGDSGSQQKK